MTDERKDWRLCARPGCTRVKMRYRTICWQCWQEIKPASYSAADRVSTKPRGVDAPWETGAGSAVEDWPDPNSIDELGQPK